ncbi:hypothetical protein [Actinomadura rupiterrae]|uniref:hypothetical protein n=1 Tax=Actinomadura rupiterrae TaxID=559627 RepID=UPI0020A4F225|nr:hypothetical protein [Actinomadura rupiterrae]MCP2341412.1 hypothetical protein [Actinomadura rupiterrae]
MTAFRDFLRKRLAEEYRALQAARDSSDDHGVLTHTFHVEELRRLAFINGIDVGPDVPVDEPDPSDDRPGTEPGA